MPVTLQDLGWNDHFQRAFDAVAKPGWMPGRLIRETKINFTALLDGGEDVDAVVSGKLWHDAATDAELPAVGDSKFTGAAWQGDGFYYSAYDRPEAGKEFSNANEYSRSTITN